MVASVPALLQQPRAGNSPSTCGTYELVKDDVEEKPKRQRNGKPAVELDQFVDSLLSACGEVYTKCVQKLSDLQGSDADYDYWRCTFCKARNTNQVMHVQCGACNHPCCALCMQDDSETNSCHRCRDKLRVNHGSTHAAVTCRTPSRKPFPASRSA